MPDKDTEKPAENIDDLAASIMDGLGYGKPPEKKPAAPEKKEEKVVAAPDDSKADEDKKEKPEPVKKPADVEPKKPEVRKPEEKPAPVIDTAKLADDVAERLAAKAAKQQPEAKADPDADLTAGDKHALRVAKFMAEQSQDMKGREGEYRAFLKAEKDYLAKWQRANPGKDFDGEDDEHEEFYSTSTPSWSDGDEFRHSETEMIADEKVTRKLAAHTAAETKRTTAERIDGNATRAANLGAKAIFEAAGVKVKTFDELSEADPVAAEAVEAVGGETASLMATAEQLLTPATPHRASKDNPLHASLMVKVSGYEKEMLAARTESPESMYWKMADGVTRQFATLEEWNAMSDRERTGCYTPWLHPELVRPMLLRDGREKLSSTIEKKRSAALSVARKHGWKEPESVPEAKPGEARKEPETKAPARKNPPSMGDEKVSTDKKGAGPKDDFSEMIQKQLYG